MNAIRKTPSTNTFSVKETKEFLRKYRYAYSDTRYFSVKKDGEIRPGFEISLRAKEVITFLSLALIAIGVVEMGRQNIEMANPLEFDILS